MELRYVLSTNLELVTSARPTVSKLLGPLLSLSLAMGLQVSKITPDFYVDAEHPNSGPQTCTGSTLLPEPSSQPFNAVFILYFILQMFAGLFFSTHNIPNRLRDLELKYLNFPF